MYYSKELMKSQNKTMFPSKSFENFFSNSEFDKIKTTAIELEENDPVVHSGQQYTKFKYYESKLHALLNKRIEDIIGKHNVYLSVVSNTLGNPVPTHTDHNLSDVRENALPYATLCIPLDVISEDNNWGTASTITFDQYYFPDQDWEYRRHIFTGFLKPNTIKNSKGFINETTITKEYYDRYLNQHEDYSFFEGMSIEKIIDWKKNSLMIWHQCRFHCSDSYLSSGTKNKKSIILWTTKESK